MGRVREVWGGLSAAGSDAGCRAVGRGQAARRGSLLALLIVTVLALFPSLASAEPLCTDSWTGPSEGIWQTASNWSTGKVPVSGDVACIGVGATVNVTGGTNQTGVLESKGTLAISGGSLEVADVLEPSSAVNLSVEGGVLTGSAEVDVSGSFVGGHTGIVQGSGTLVIQSGATGEVQGGSAMVLGRTLMNKGSFTIPNGSGISGEETARFVNSGTLTVNGEEKVNTGMFRQSFSGTIPVLVNTGTLQRTEGTGQITIEFAINNEGLVNVHTGHMHFSSGGTSGAEHTGSWAAASGSSVELTGGTFSLGSSVPVSGSGTFLVSGGGTAVTAGTIEGSTATVSVTSGSVTVNGTSPSSVNHLEVLGGAVGGSGEIDVSGSFVGGHTGIVQGSGTLVIQSGATGEVQGGSAMVLGRTLMNKGSFTIPNGSGISGEETARFVNSGTLTVNGEEKVNTGMFRQSFSGTIPVLVNTGTLQRTEGTGQITIEFAFESFGIIIERTGKFHFTNPVIISEPATGFGAENPSALSNLRSLCGKPVDCVTGNETESQTDLAIGGRGVGFELTRTYNAQAAAKAGSAGAFGYGWTSSFGDRLVVEPSVHLATLYQANGSTVPFAESGGAFTAPAWSADMLTGSVEAGYTVTLVSQAKFHFSGAGRLEYEEDRNANKTTLEYNEKGQLAAISDPASRKIKLVYNSEGLVETATDPMGHVVKYAYEGGNLVSVTLPGETSPNRRFKYDGSHRMTGTINGLGGETTNVYDGSNRVTSQKDPLGHTLKFEYEPFQTKITNEATGAVTLEQYGSDDLLRTVTRGYGTSSATTEALAYNERGEPIAITDGNGHTTRYEYDGAGNRTKMVDANEHETKWTYNSTHDVETMTTPKGETTTIKRDSHGNAESISRSALKEATQTTKYTYDSHGDVESMTDPLGRIWKYEYDSYGDRSSEVDPETDKRTWVYDEDSRETSMVSPRGNVTGGKPSEYTTKIERDAQGRASQVVDPLAHKTVYTYDADGNVETVTDANGHKTTYTYDANNQPIKVKQANGILTETGYDGAGHVVNQTDGKKNETKYVRNVLGEVTEVIDPRGRKTVKEYDAAGNLKTLKDPATRTATYTYDPANRLVEVGYSDGKTHLVKYEYDADGDRTSVVDGTGTTSYIYDQLDRLVESKDGHGDVVKYEYDLADEQTKITYPNGKAVTRVYDKTGRLQKVTDWLEHSTKFSYNADSELKSTTLPTGTSEEDLYSYNTADQMTEVLMKKGTETLVSLVYSRDGDGQVKKTVAKGLPGTEAAEYVYDENNRLIKAGATAYEYNLANSPNKIAGGTYTYDKASEPETGPSLKYTYDEMGERTKTTPTTGPATTYGYDQAGNLVSVSRPVEGETPKIEDAYAYDGNGLRASQTISGKTAYFAWGYGSSALPLLLNDGTNSYIYGPGSEPIEQIDSEGKILYLHHDQQGSTRMLTDTTGTVKATVTYDAYGNTTGTTGTSTTPLGYDGQYTSTDTGLIYLRARAYDPATGQFMSADPIAGLTLAPYNYVNDNPLNYNDPTGLIFGIPGTPSTSQIAGTVAEGAESAANAVNTAGKAMAGVAHYAAPVINATAAGICILAPEGCAVAFVANLGVQQLLAADQAVYNPNYNLGLNEAALFAGAGLGAVGISGVAGSELSYLGRLALGGAVSSPQFFLDAAELLSPEQAEALVVCQ